MPSTRSRTPGDHRDRHRRPSRRRARTRSTINAPSHGQACAKVVAHPRMRSTAQWSGRAPLRSRYAASSRRMTEVDGKAPGAGRRQSGMVSNSDGGLNVRRCRGEYPNAATASRCALRRVALVPIEAVARIGRVQVRHDAIARDLRQDRRRRDRRRSPIAADDAAAAASAAPECETRRRGRNPAAGPAPSRLRASP